MRALVIALLALAPSQEEFFNGRDLAGWEGKKELWKVENGEIVGKWNEVQGAAYLVHSREIADFRLTLEVKLVEDKANSGVQFRSEKIDGDDMKGYQADIGPGAWGKLVERNGRDALSEEGGEEHVKAGEWNTYEILAVGSRIQLALNGKKCADVDDKEPRKKGLIALQMAGEGECEVRFKNLKLELNPELKLKTVK